MCVVKTSREKRIKKALEKEGIKVLRSDNIEIGGRIPLPNGKVGIICEDTHFVKRV